MNKYVCKDLRTVSLHNFLDKFIGTLEGLRNKIGPKKLDKIIHNLRKKQKGWRKSHQWYNATVVFCANCGGLAPWSDVPQELLSANNAALKMAGGRCK